MRRRLPLALLAMLIGGLGYWFFRPKPVPVVAAPELRLVWSFEAPGRSGSAIATPLVTPETIYLAAVHARGFRLSGAVYAIDTSTGNQRGWVFDHDGRMLPTASTPVLRSGRLFLGEGMHANFDCHFYCLDATTGRVQWTLPTADHIEGEAAVEGGTLFFPAGNDGVYAVNADSGQAKWNFRADRHIDSCPAVAEGRVFVGSGPSRRFGSTEVICLDAASGNPIWRTATTLPAWGSQTVAAGRVFVGLGNGRLTEAAKPPETPAGALACFDAATGANRWTFSVPDSVFGRPVVLGDRVIFGSRDGNLYGLTLDGERTFQVPLGSPVMAAPTAVGEMVVAVSAAGRIVAVDPLTGEELWRHELAQHHTTAHVYAAVRVLDRQLFVAAEIRTAGSAFGIVSLSCFELPIHGKGQR